MSFAKLWQNQKICVCQSFCLILLMKVSFHASPAGRLENPDQETTDTSGADQPAPGAV